MWGVGRLYSKGVMKKIELTGGGGEAGVVACIQRHRCVYGGGHDLFFKMGGGS